MNQEVPATTRAADLDPERQGLEAPQTEEIQDNLHDLRPPYERGWQRRDDLTLLRYKVNLAKARGDLCGEFASMVKLALERHGTNGEIYSAPITLEELDITAEELDDIIREGAEKTARRIALLKSNTPKPEEETT